MKQDESSISYIGGINKEEPLFLCLSHITTAATKTDTCKHNLVLKRGLFLFYESVRTPCHFKKVCHGALGVSLWDMMTSVKSMMQINSLNLSLFSDIKDMKSYLHATWRIFGFIKPSWRRSGSFLWVVPVIASLTVMRERVRKAVREWMFSTLRLKSHVIESPHYKARGSLQIHWGSFGTWECRHKSTWDVTGCV